MFKDDEFLQKVFKGVSIPDEDIEECGFNNSCFEKYCVLSGLFRPKKILEIGTRRGYSLIALTKKQESVEFVLSCDVEDYIPGSQTVAAKNLGDSGYKGKAEFMVASSNSDEFRQRLSKEGATFDLIHIDGSHDFQYVVGDLELCLPSLTKCGVILAHDYVYISEVKRAVDQFVAKNQLGMIEIEMYRGMAIIQKRRV